jgi:S1-C subfamily serine protease
MRTGVVSFLLVQVAALGCSRPPEAPTGNPGVKPPEANKYVEVPPTPPKLGQVAYRPTFTFTKGRPASAGTAFVVKAKSGDKYLLTAAHLFGPEEWKTVKEVSLATMAGGPVGKSEGAPRYIGEEMNTNVSPPTTEKDLAVWKLAAGDTTVPLPLAERVPNTNRLWVVGAEVGKPGGQKTFECKPQTFYPRGTTIFKQTEPVVLRAFSGGPIINNEGKAVANLLGGGEGQIIGASAEQIRQRLAENGIEAE